MFQILTRGEDNTTLHLTLVRVALTLLVGRMDPKQNTKFTSLSDSLARAIIKKARFPKDGGLQTFLD